MKKRLLIFPLFIFTCLSYAQFGDQQVIDDPSIFAWQGIPTDFNDDGFTDFITYASNSVLWYQNLDGEGHFSDAIAISEPGLGIQKMVLADVDIDGDEDLIFFTNGFNKIGWLEKLDDVDEFGPLQIIWEVDKGFWELAAGDLNNDGAPDIIFSSYTAGIGPEFYKIMNSGDGSSFETPELIELGFTEDKVVLFRDLDDDGDLDLLTGVSPALQPGGFIWYENLDGLGTLSDWQFIFQFGFFVSDVTRVRNLSTPDINQDGLDDILFSTEHDDFGYRIYWMQNLGGVANYSSSIEIGNPGGKSIRGLEAIDIDLDDDLDIYYGADFIHQLGWYEQTDVPGVFEEVRIIPSVFEDLRYTASAFINSDDLVDIIAIANGPDVFWHENLGILSVTDQQTEGFSVYPNPSDGIVEIQSMTPIKAVEVFSVLGQSVKTFTDSNVIDLTSLQTGIYFLKIQDNSGHISTKRILIN